MPGSVAMGRNAKARATEWPAVNGAQRQEAQTALRKATRLLMPGHAGWQPPPSAARKMLRKLRMLHPCRPPNAQAHPRPSRSGEAAQTGSSREACCWATTQTDASASDVEPDPVLAGYSDHPWDIWRTRGHFAIQRREHLDRPASCTCDLQHLATAWAIAERVNGAGRDMDQCASRAHRSIAAACELNVALGYVKRLVPVVAVGWRTRSLVTRLQCDLLAPGVRVRNEYGDSCADDVEGSAAIARFQYKLFRSHDLASRSTCTTRGCLAAASLVAQRLS